MTGLRTRAGADRRPTAVSLAAGLGWAILLAVPASPAIAQAWTQAAPSFSARTETVAEAAAPLAVAPVSRRARLAEFNQHPASVEVQHVAHWALDSGDNSGMPYVIIDKVNATVFVFDAKGQLEGVEPALLGMATGDHAVPDIGKQKLSAMRPEDRITPAGRFEASIARDLQGQDILWVDYGAALALHRVAKGTAAERRAERLLSATSDDNRISYGCINVAATFFEKVVSPAFSKSSGIVYILPETGLARELFNSYHVTPPVPVDGLKP